MSWGPFNPLSASLRLSVPARVLLNTAAYESECWHIYTSSVEWDWQSLPCSFQGEAQKFPSFCSFFPGVAKHDGSTCFLCKIRLFEKKIVAFVSEILLQWLQKCELHCPNFRRSSWMFRLYLQMGWKQWMVVFSYAAVQNGRNTFMFRSTKIQSFFWLMGFISHLSSRNVYSLLCISLFLDVLLRCPSKDVHLFLEWLLSRKNHSFSSHRWKSLVWEGQSYLLCE